VASPIFWSLGSLYAAWRAVLPTPALFASCLEMINGGLLLGAAAFVSGELATFDVAAVTPVSWAGLLYLLVVGSLVGYTTYTWLLGFAPMPRLSTHSLTARGRATSVSEGAEPSGGSLVALDTRERPAA
jgi:hypothetical protein